MKAFHFRPLAPGAAYLRSVGRRLAAKLPENGGVRHEVHDGYLLRAVGGRSSTTVTAIDPDAVWLFLHHQPIPGGDLQRLLGVRQFDRGAITGDGPAAPVELAGDNALFRWVPGAGYVDSIDMGALNILTNEVSIPAVQGNQVSVTTRNTSGSFTIGNVAWSTRFQLYVQCFAPPVPMIAPGTSTEGRAIRVRDLRDVLLPEAGLRTLIGDSTANMVLRGSFFGAGIPPGFAGQVARHAAVLVDGVAQYTDVVVAGAYVAQTEAQPYQPRVGVFVVRLRRPSPLPGATYPLVAVEAWSQLATANPEPELVPSTYSYLGSTAYYNHRVRSVGMAYQPPAPDADDVTLLLAAVDCRNGDGVLWAALQARIVSAGATTTVTLRKTTEQKGWHMGPELTLFGVHGLLVVEGTVGATPELTLWHVGVDGVMRETGLHTAGWQPLTNASASTPTAVVDGNTWGQAALYAADLGDGKVGVLARNTPVDATETMTAWTLVVLDKATGAFVEARGALPAMPRYFTYNLHLAVLTPETRRADNTVQPAVLLATLYNDYYLSRDGGLTWTAVFYGFAGYPLYVGNQLHQVEIGQTL